MFQENLKVLRKKKGMTQEELAVRLNVVRQTVSKWEKGLSVPDSDLLVKLAEVLDVPVSRLLGAEIEDEAQSDALTEQLSRINEQLAIKNRTTKKVLKTIIFIVIGIIAAYILLFAFSVLFFSSANDKNGVSQVDNKEITYNACSLNTSLENTCRQVFSLE